MKTNKHLGQSVSLVFLLVVASAGVISLISSLP